MYEEEDPWETNDSQHDNLKPEKKKLSDKDKFTDRDEFRKMLKTAVEVPQSVLEHRIKVVYGAGGQGKSALKSDFFVEYLKTLDKNYIYSDKIDFEHQPKTLHKDEALLRIAEDLITKGKIPLPAFCLGFLRYEMMTSPQKNIQEKYPYLYKIKFLEGDLANEIFSTVLSSALDIVSAGSQMLPGVGFFTKKISDKGYKKIVEWIQNSNARKVLGDLDELSSFQLLERLPLLLAYDVRNYLRKGLTPETPYPQKRIVIVIDGYEALWKNSNSTDTDNDLWIMNMVEHMPGVLFVIFGRDSLLWTERNDIFEGKIEHFLIKGLEESDADGFLQLSDVEEEEIRQQIVQSSKNQKSPEDGCLPFYLDLQIKTYENIKDKGKLPTKEDFDKKDEKVIEHFLEHLPKDVSGAIKALSIAPYIDEEIIELFSSRSFINPGSISLKNLGRYSFVRFDNERASMHGLMKEKASKQFKEEHKIRYQKINETLFEYFESKLPSVAKELDADIERLLEYSSYHKEIIDSQNYYMWAWDKARFFYGKDVYGALKNILEKALVMFFENKRNEVGQEQINVDDFTLNEALALSGINYYLANRYNWMNEYANAEIYIKESLACIELKVNDEEINKLNKLYNAGSDLGISLRLLMQKESALELYAGVLESLDRYVEAGIIYHDAFTLASDFNLEFDHLAYAVYFSEVGRFAEAEPVIFGNYQQAKENYLKNINGENHEAVGLAAHKLAKILFKEKRYDEAIRYHEEAVEIYEKIRSPSHEYSGIVKGSLFHTLVKQNIDLTRAEKLLKEVTEIYENKYEEDHLNYGYFYIQQGNYYVAKNDIDTSRILYDKGSQILAKNLGANCKAIIESYFQQCFIAHEGYKVGTVDKSIYKVLVKTLSVPMRYVFDHYKNIFSIYNPDFHHAMDLVANALQEEGDFDFAKSLYLKKKEFVRISTKRTAVRNAHFAEYKLSEQEKNQYLKNFKALISLPEDFSQLELVAYELPFYKSFRLFKIVYKNTTLLVQRYILSDGNVSKLINYKNSPIYKVSETDGIFNSQNVFDYIKFFFDSVCGRAGFFYLISDPQDIPWKVDVEIPQEIKDRVYRELKAPKIIEEDEKKLVVEVYLLFVDTVFRSRVTVYKTAILNDKNEEIYKKGICQLSHECVCYFRTDGSILHETPQTNENGDVTNVYLNADGDIVEINENEDLLSVIDACIDPAYHHEKVKEGKDKNFNDQLIEALSLCRLFAEYYANVISDTIDSDVDDFDYHGYYQECCRVFSCVTNKQSITYDEILEVLDAAIHLHLSLIDQIKETFGTDDYRYLNSLQQQQIMKSVNNHLIKLKEESAGDNSMTEG